MRYRDPTGKRRHKTSTATTRDDAELELQDLVADVRRGRWTAPAEPVAVEVTEEPSFHRLASE
jgi:hypothetical protein